MPKDRLSSLHPVRARRPDPESAEYGTHHNHGFGDDYSEIFLDPSSPIFRERSQRVRSLEPRLLRAAKKR